MLPRAPNYEFGISSSSLIMVEPAGKIPMSILMKKYAKNYKITNLKTIPLSISGGK